MSELNSEMPPFRMDDRRQGGTAKQAGLLPGWVKDGGFLIAVWILALVAFLDQAFQSPSWSGFLAALVTIGTAVLWTKHVVDSRQRERERSLTQRELYVVSWLDRVDAMSGTQFEQYIAKLLRLDGHQDVQVIGGKDDGGVDVISTDPSGCPMAYQCKRQMSRVGVGVVRQLIGSIKCEHRGLKGVLVTSAELTISARRLADRAGVEVIERAALRGWIDRARNLIEQEGNAPSTAGLAATSSSARARATTGWPAVLGLVLAGFIVAITVHSTAHVASAPILPSGSSMSPAQVVEADFAAINRRDWPAVWRLWRHSVPGHGPGYAKMVAGYRLTARDVVTSLKANGDMVSARLLAYETTGAVQIYKFTFEIRGGKIIWGRSVLLNTSYPGAHIMRFSTLAADTCLLMTLHS